MGLSRKGTDMDRPARILVVDDEGPARMALAELLREEGYLADTAGDGFKALARAEEVRPDLILTDLRMPSMDGLELVRRLRRADVTAPVVVMTAFGGVDVALDSMREGAIDFVVKPLDTNQLLSVIEQALKNARRNGEPVLEQPEPDLPGVVAQSHEMREVVRRIQRVAPTRANVFLRGEPGTGRARLARALHGLSRQSEGPFAVLRCRDVAERATTAADIARDEVRKAAGEAVGGTLYLADVAELPIELQGALLDALPSPAVSNPPVRVIASGLFELRDLAAGGVFREDLARLLSVVELRVPSLRERPEDLIPLARSLMGQRCPGLSAEVVNRLRRYDWPNNLPELRQVLTQAQSRSDGSVIRAEHLSIPARSERQRPAIPGARLDEIERYAILQTLAAQGGSTSRAARVLGISVRKIQYKLHEYGASRKAPGHEERARES